MSTICDYFFLVDVSDIFYFFLLGGGEGEFGATWRGGGRFFIENPKGGGTGLSGGGGRGPGGCVQGIWGGGGAKYFLFSGPKRPPSLGLRSQGPPREVKIGNRENYIFGVKSCLFGGSPWNHLNWFFGACYFLPEY